MNIKTILKESEFNPKAPGPLAAMLESRDPKYLEQRAVELIRESQLSTRKVEKHRVLKQAISLLAAARGLLGSPEEVTGNPVLPESLRNECKAEFLGIDGAPHNCNRAAKHRGPHAFGSIKERCNAESSEGLKCVQPKGHTGDHLS